VTAGQFANSARAASPATEALLAQWRLWMVAGAMSQRTIVDRLHLIRLVEARIDDSAVTCTWQHLAAFFADQIDVYSAGTRSTYFQHLKQWFKWLVIMDHRLDDPTAKLHPPRSPRRQPRPISVDQLRQILESGRFYGRTRTMILLAAYEGLRVHEIAKFRGEDIRGGELHVVGKGQVVSVLPLHDLIAAESERYPQGWWFPSDRTTTGHVLANSVSAVVGDALERAGVHATPHQLRHFFGTEVFRSSGGNLRVAQELLRHASPATTALYTKVDDAERRAAITSLGTSRPASKTTTTTTERTAP
jgi:integrase/recombinase XerD